MSRAVFEQIQASILELEQQTRSLYADHRSRCNNSQSSVLVHPKIANSITDLIGRTPLLRLNKLNTSGKAEILLKLESMEPCNSVKVILQYPRSTVQLNSMDRTVLDFR